MKVLKCTNRKVHKALTVDRKCVHTISRYTFIVSARQVVRKIIYILWCINFRRLDMSNEQQVKISTNIDFIYYVHWFMQKSTYPRKCLC